MTKYICEYLDGNRKCTHETSGFSTPTLCCVRTHATCHWRTVENQEVETPAPKLPDWCKVGAWVWHDEIGYGKLEQEPRTGELLVFFGGGTRAFEAERYKEARLRPWNDDELKSKVGKVFEMGNGDLTLCLGYQRDIADLIFVGKLMSAQSFAESDWKLDGSPCGVLEHTNDQGEWVK
ncbi:MAG: hypothetical protein ACI4UV_01580 [Victivallales bacterium]